MDRQTWGDEKAIGGGFGSGGITIVIGDVVKDALPAPIEGVVVPIPRLPAPVKRIRSDAPCVKATYCPEPSTRTLVLPLWI